MKATIHIGTSGWHYSHWVGPFYPDHTSPRDFLRFYSNNFSAVEINSSFYSLRSKDAFAGWRDSSPSAMVFACKASRYITHLKKLKEPQQSTQKFFNAVDVLGDKLGPVLFQLPPRWKANPGRLRTFLAALPSGYRFAFEFRDHTWFSSEIYNILSRHGAALCAYDLDGYRSPVELTADFAYVRLHGPDGPYEGDYDGRTLYGWVRRFRHWQDAGNDVYCFFDNDENGYAARNALTMQTMLEH